MRAVAPHAAASSQHAVRPFTSGALPPRPQRCVAARVNSGGRMEPFNEGATQVRRLISRDKKEFLGNDGGLLEQYETEFGADSPAATNDSSAAAAAPKNPQSASPGAAAAAASVSVSSGVSPLAKPNVTASTPNPFGSSSALGTTSPFGSKVTSKRSIEPMGLSPDMSPDPFTKERGFDIFKDIGVTQILIVLSFTLIIGLMLATFNVALNAGAIRIAGLE